MFLKGILNFCPIVDFLIAIGIILGPPCEDIVLSHTNLGISTLPESKI